MSSSSSDSKQETPKSKDGNTDVNISQDPTVKIDSSKVDATSGSVVSFNEKNDEPNSSPFGNKQRTRKGSYRARSASTSQVSNKLHSDQRQKDVHTIVDLLFHDVSNLIKGESQVAMNDLKVLEQMNQLVSKKYDNMHQKTQAIREHVENMKQQYERCKPYFEQIDELDKSADELVNVVKYLDSYTSQLEKQLRPYLM